LLCVQTVYCGAGRYTSLQLLVEVYHCSVINGFLQQGRPDRLQCIFQLGNRFLALAVAYRKTPAFPSKHDNPEDWDRVNLRWHLSVVMKSLQFDF